VSCLPLLHVLGVELGWSRFLAQQFVDDAALVEVLPRRASQKENTVSRENTRDREKCVCVLLLYILRARERTRCAQLRVSQLEYTENTRYIRYLYHLTAF